MTIWAATKAKAQFSAVLDKAESEGPQLVTRRNREFYVLTKEQLTGQPPVANETPFVSAWDALRPSFEDRFDVEFPRSSWKMREIDLG